jgi:hypothetical protein
MLKLNSPYVAGETRILLRGKVTSVDYATGHMTVGRQSVDFSALLANAVVNVAVGQTVSVVGTQPAAKSIVLATSVR